MSTTAPRKEEQGKDRRVPTSLATADPTAYNVREIAQLEHQALHARTTTEKVSDVITGKAGSLTFLLLHVAGFAFWGVVNVGLIPGVEPFDPFPFGILTLIVSSEGVFLAIFILITQNRMTRLSERRAHLDLQISMLAEQEMTMMLRMQQRLCEHLGVKTDSIREEAKRLMNRTDVHRIVSEIEEELPSA
jgi:uncharacterized membrane protein